MNPHFLFVALQLYLMFFAIYTMLASIPNAERDTFIHLYFHNFLNTRMQSNATVDDGAVDDDTVDDDTVIDDTLDVKKMCFDNFAHQDVKQCCMSLVLRWC